MWLKLKPLVWNQVFAPDLEMSKGGEKGTAPRVEMSNRGRGSISFQLAILLRYDARVGGSGGARCDDGSWLFMADAIRELQSGQGGKSRQAVNASEREIITVVDTSVNKNDQPRFELRRLAGKTFIRSCDNRKQRQWQPQAGAVQWPQAKAETRPWAWGDARAWTSSAVADAAVDEDEAATAGDPLTAAAAADLRIVESPSSAKSRSPKPPVAPPPCSDPEYDKPDTDSADSRVPRTPTDSPQPARLLALTCRAHPSQVPMVPSQAPMVEEVARPSTEVARPSKRVKLPTAVARPSKRVKLPTEVQAEMQAEVREAKTSEMQAEVELVELELIEIVELVLLQLVELELVERVEPEVPTLVQVKIESSDDDDEPEVPDSVERVQPKVPTLVQWILVKSQVKSDAPKSLGKSESQEEPDAPERTLPSGFKVKLKSPGSAIPEAPKRASDEHPFQKLAAKAKAIRDGTYGD